MTVAPAPSEVSDGLPRQPEPRTAAEVQAAIEALVPVLRERAAETDRERRISPEVFRLIQEAGMFHILKPKEYGGFELTEHDHAMAVMTMARGCASTAWVASILSSDNIAIVAYPQETQDEIWGDNTYATLAGNTNLNLKARTERVRGGYRLTGSWGFCSGSDFSEWLIFNAPAGENAEGHMFLVPREETVTVDDWFPSGLRGTGSRTMAVEDVFVPDHRVQATKDTVEKIRERRTLHPTFDTMYAPWPSPGKFPFASAGVGAALGAVEQFAETVGSSTRVANALGGTVKLADQEYVATEFAEAAGEAEMARLMVEAGSAHFSELARQHQTPTAQDLGRGLRDNALVTRVALRSVSRIFSLVGAKAGFPDHPISRAKRDLELVSHHVTLNWRQNALQYMASRV